MTKMLSVGCWETTGQTPKFLPTNELQDKARNATTTKKEMQQFIENFFIGVTLIWMPTIHLKHNGNEG